MWVVHMPQSPWLQVPQVSLNRMGKCETKMINEASTPKRFTNYRRENCKIQLILEGYNITIELAIRT